MQAKGIFGLVSNAVSNQTCSIEVLFTKPGSNTPMDTVSLRAQGKMGEQVMPLYEDASGQPITGHVRNAPATPCPACLPAASPSLHCALFSGLAVSAHSVCGKFRRHTICRRDSIVKHTLRAAVDCGRCCVLCEHWFRMHFCWDLPSWLCRLRRRVSVAHTLCVLTTRVDTLWVMQQRWTYSVCSNGDAAPRPAWPAH